MALFPAKRHFWADVAVFQDLNAGKAVETFFKNKGLQARTYDDKLFRYFLFLRPPCITHRVQVRQNYLKEAGEFLNAEAPGDLQKAIRCPACDSLQVSYPQMTRKFILPTILLHLGIIFRMIEHECFCEHCHHVWNLPGENIHPETKVARPFPF